MTQSINKITPTHDISWYIKWISTVILITGMAMTSLELYPLNLLFHLIGVLGWLIVGIMWHDRALMVVNSIAVFIYLMGLLGATF